MYRRFGSRAAGALAIVLGVLAATVPAGALEDRVTKDDCKGDVWHGLVNGSGTSFANLGQCVAAALQGNAYTDPRFVSGTAVLQTKFSMAITFHQIGMLPGDERQYDGFAGVTMTDVCRPEGDFTAPGVTRTGTGALGGFLSATSDARGEVRATFTVQYVSGSRICEVGEMGSRTHELQVSVDFAVVVDREARVFYQLI